MKSAENAIGSPRNVYADLAAEGEVLDHLISGLDPGQWSRPTPAPGWTVAHQVAHLASIARLAVAAATDREMFSKQVASAAGDFDAAVEALLQPYISLPPDALLARWREDRAAANDALRALPPTQLVPWLARELPAAILASAGVMELVAHGQDIIDAVGGRREHTDRIWHATAFAVGNWDFGYLVRGLTPPAEQFRFELVAPSGQLWEFGPVRSKQVISGPAIDFCLLATRRRHRDDVALAATGDEADHWLNIAQGYRGSPGPGRQPGMVR
jgi:uncharacterized protein (TIGR03084 family)